LLLLARAWGNAHVMVTVRHPSRAVVVRVLSSAVLLAGVLGCSSKPQRGPVAIASTPPATSPTGQPASSFTNPRTAGTSPAPVTPTPGASAGIARLDPRRPVPLVLPPVAGRFDYQLGGAYTPPSGTRIVERDRSSAPASWTYGICYVNAFQTQPDELAWWKARHRGVLLANAGMYVEDPDWPGEVLLDTSTARKRAEAAAVVAGWIDGCAAKGYRAVELDNLDSWTRSGGRLTSASNVAFAKLLVARAHARRLAVAQKNAAELAQQGRGIGFDFAIAEECQVYGECAAYTSAYGEHVIEVEYADDGLDTFTQACAVRGRQISLVLRDRDLVRAGDGGYAYRRC
jgi:hypothetical protein